jgi:hypothetical protein
MIGIRAGIETALLGFIQDFGRESEHYIVKGEAKLISIIIVYTKICCVYLYLYLRTKTLQLKRKFQTILYDRWDFAIKLIQEFHQISKNISQEVLKSWIASASVGSEG